MFKRRVSVVMPFQGNILSGDGHSILHRVSDVRRYAPGYVLKSLEKEAREAQRGLWADPYPVTPWEWRKPK
jgi:endonuclease YncB( thermonuclease family)